MNVNGRGIMVECAFCHKLAYEHIIYGEPYIVKNTEKGSICSKCVKLLQNYKEMCEYYHMELDDIINGAFNKKTSIENVEQITGLYYMLSENLLPEIEEKLFNTIGYIESSYGIEISYDPNLPIEMLLQSIKTKKTLVDVITYSFRRIMNDIMKHPNKYKQCNIKKDIVFQNTAYELS